MGCVSFENGICGRRQKPYVYVNVK